jgi:excisionase family DNA binding protein
VEALEQGQGRCHGKKLVMKIDLISKGENHDHGVLLKPVTLRSDLTDMNSATSYSEIYAELMNINLAVYTPIGFPLSSAVEKHIDKSVNINRAGREHSIRHLMSINLLKRLEIFTYAFRLTFDRIKGLIGRTIDTIEEYLDVSRETVLQWIDNKGMPAHKAGREWKFKISEVDEQIRSGEAADKE